MSDQTKKAGNFRVALDVELANADKQSQTIWKLFCTWLDQQPITKGHDLAQYVSKMMGFKSPQCSIRLRSMNVGIRSFHTELGNLTEAQLILDCDADVAGEYERYVDQAVMIDVVGEARRDLRNTAPFTFPMTPDGIWQLTHYNPENCCRILDYMDGNSDGETSDSFRIKEGKHALVLIYCDQVLVLLKLVAHGTEEE